MRYVPRDEREACRFYAQEQGKASGSPEDLAVSIEEQPDLDRSDELRGRLADGVRAGIAHDELAVRIARVWEQHGDAFKPREIAALLSVPVGEVYRATRLIRYQAAKAKKVLRRNAAKGGVS